MGLLEDIASVVYQVLNYIAGLVQKIVQYIADILATVANFIISIFATIRDAMAKFFTDLGTFITKLVTGITAVFDKILDEIGDAFAAVWAKIAEVSIGVLDKIRVFIEGIYSQLRIIAAQVIDSVTQWIKGVTATITGLVENAIEYIGGIVRTVTDTVSSVFNAVMTAAEVVFKGVVARIDFAYVQLITGATSIIASVESRLSQLQGAFADAAIEAVKGLGEIADEQLAPIRAPLVKALEPLMQYLTGADLAQLSHGFESIVAPHTLALDNREQARAIVEGLIPKSPMGRTLFLVAFNIASALSIYGGITSANAQVVLQEFALVYPYQLLPPTDLVALWRRDPTRRAATIIELRKQGYDEVRAGEILSASSQRPAVGDLLEMLRRDPALEPEVDSALTVHGIDGAWQSRVKALAQVLPSVQDLIVMAVREVFSPEIVKEFGQDQAFPEAFAVHAKRLGLSEEWARNYWSAHWSLPSASQGFEMLQRAVIEPPQLDMLLRALDVMPFWRDKLTRIAYLPFTRVDIRRMHQLGILSEDEVHRAHMDLGYDETKATALTQFVLALNRHKPAEDDEELGRLSRVQILNFYADGIVSKDRALALLIGLGHTNEAATLLLAAEDLDQQRQHRKAETDLVIELAEAGTITFDEAQDKLNALGLVPVEKERALTQLLRSEQRKVKLPTRDDADRFLKAGIIKAEEYLDLLGRLGFSLKWANAYLRVVTAPKAKA